MNILDAFSCISSFDPGRDHGLRPLLKNRDGKIAKKEWEETLRPVIRRRWLDLLGRPSFPPDSWIREERLLDELDTPDFHAQLFDQSTGPGHFQKAILLRPTKPARSPMPCAVVPYYYPGEMAGLCIGSPKGKLRRAARTARSRWIAFGAHLTRLGFLVACVEAFPFNTVPRPKGNKGFDWWQCATKKILKENPEWTGIGKLAHDTSRGVDLLFKQPGADTSRVLAMGHSLGGKMALYASLVDSRIGCVVGSDFGLPWHSTNWNAPWYLGRKFSDAQKKMAHHELLALLAPRPFFLIAGEVDNRESWQYLEAARPVYQLYRERNKLGGIDHASGHEPVPVAALDITYAWLAEVFDLPHRRWRESETAP